MASPQREEAGLLDFLIGQTAARFCFVCKKTVPALREINKFTNQGFGEDGFVLSTWEPFEINEAEYEELREEFHNRLESGGVSGSK